jgi:hypothetical protein
MTEQLHPERKDRRETMLDELIVAMRHHHRRRRQVRTAALWCLLLAVAGGTWIVRARQVGRPPGFDNTHAHLPLESPAPRVERVSGGYRTGLVKVIDDDELVLRLAEIDRPAGLIRTEGRVWLTTAVADAEIETGDEPEPPL